MSEFRWPDPIQGGDEPVTRQRGIDPRLLPTPPPDPMAERPVIQGSTDIFTTRNKGNGAQWTGSDGTIHTDRKAEDGTTNVDGDLMATGDVVADSPIGATEDAGFPGHPGVVPGIPLAQMAGNVVASDKPAPGQQAEAAPQVFTREDVERAKAAQIAKAAEKTAAEKAAAEKAAAAKAGR